MTKETNTELNEIVIEALLKLQKFVENNSSSQHNMVDVARIFLVGVISTAVDFVEANTPGSALLIYADVEAAAKLGGMRKIREIQSANGSINYSISNIEENDMPTAMNYLGQELSAALYKGLHELPIPLRGQEVMLRGIEVLLANLLNQKFENSHHILDSLCEHVHMALDDLQKRAH